MLNNCSCNDKHIITEVAEAFSRIAPSSHRHFATQGAAVKIMQGFYELTQKSEEAAEEAWKAMIDIGRINYRLMDSYMGTLLTMTMDLVQKAISQNDVTN